MKKIFIRSPYFVTVDAPSQTSAKLEIRLWNKGDVIPIDPNYILSENVPSAIQTKLSWNISNYAKDFIKPIRPVNVTEPTEEDVNTWCYMDVKRFSDNIYIDNETFVCLNGYTDYMNGYNQYSDDAFVPLLNSNLKVYQNNTTYINVWLKGGIDYNWSGDSEMFFYVESDGIFKLPIINYIANIYNLYNETEGLLLLTINYEQICEPIYTPLTCSFINRFGGWKFLTFFKASSQQIEVESKEYKLMPSDINYNVYQGQTKRFNFQGKRTIKCNTGWVDENYSELIQDLLLSEVVLLDDKPVLVKSKSIDVKTHLKDKNINYEIEFEYNFGLINDVI